MKTYDQLTGPEQALALAHARLQVSRYVVDQLPHLPLDQDLKKSLNGMVKSARKLAGKLGCDSLVYHIVDGKLGDLVEPLVMRIASTARYPGPNDPLIIAGIAGARKDLSHADSRLPELPPVPGDAGSA